MSREEKVEKLAEEVVNASVEFDQRLHGKGPFPKGDLKSFFEAVVRYSVATRGHPMVHRSVTETVSSLREILELESSRAPGQAIADADRMESMLLGGCHRDGARARKVR